MNFLSTNRKAATQLALKVFLPLQAVLIACITLFFFFELASIRGAIEQREAHTLKLSEKLVNSAFKEIIADTQYLAATPTAINWLKSGSDSSKADITINLLNFATRRQIYDQVRILSLDGLEKIRINKSANRYVIASDAELQNKRGRYYVDEGLKLSPEQVYISPFDLNLEHEKIEQPIKPVIRFVSPIYDNDKNRLALLVLNYLGHHLLDELTELGDAFSTGLWLMNGDGFWLLGPTKNVEWGFMYPDGTNNHFGAIYPKDWKTIQQTESGHLNNNLGFISFRKIHLNSIGTGAAQTWIVLTHVPNQSYSMPSSSLERYLLVTLLLTITLAIGCQIFANNETARRTSAKRILIEQSRFRDLLDCAPDCIIIVDQNGVITSANKKADEEFGYASGELLGSPIERIIPTRHHHKHKEYRENFILHPVTRPMGEGRILFGLRKDNIEFPVEVSLSSTMIDQSQSVTAIVRNVSSRVAHERDIQNLNEALRLRTQELEVLNKELESFSYSVSHDLRAPLRAMDGFSLSLLNSYHHLLDEKGLDRLNRIRAAAQKMAALIDDLLMLSRISRADMRLQDLDLSALAREIILDLAQNSPPRTVSIDIEDNLFMRGDVALMKIALTNLLSNAWKFTSKTDNPTIQVGREDQNGEMVFFVRDNGAGFDMDYSNNLFGAFQRLHDNNEFPGTGIGLATVKRIIHRHGGEIWAIGKVNAGAAVYFKIQNKL